MKTLILSFHQPEEGSFDMGYTRAWGFNIFQDGSKFFKVEYHGGGSDIATRIDGSTFFLDHDPWERKKEEVSAGYVRKELKAAEKDPRYTVHTPPSFQRANAKREVIKKFATTRKRR